MAKQLRYMGEFLSRAGVTWRVEILQEAAAPFDEVGSLTFEANQALTIEWPDTVKEDVICGSTATIRIESPGDRTYEDLYTIEVGRIRMDVYREGALYWSGTLDPEFYEEPYERAANYEVSLTFSDFGILQRKKYAMAGMRTLADILGTCLAESGILFTDVDQSLISTGLYGSTPMDLRDVKVRSDNFYDEDGEASTLEDVIIGIFQPLGLRVMQRCGKIYVYDLNGLYTKGKPAEAVWSGDSSTMSTDVVYNNAKVTWSPYAQSGNLSPEDCWTQEVDPNLVNINNLETRTYKGSEYISYHYSTDLLDWIDATDSGFTLWLNDKGINADISGAAGVAKFFKIVPQYDGSECEGVAFTTPRVWAWKVQSGKSWAAQARYGKVGINPAYIQGTAKDIDLAIFRSARVWIPPTDKPGDLLLHITLDLLLDPRFNPFEQASNFMKLLEQADWQKQWKARGNYLYVPVTIKFKPDGSDQIYCWDNRDICKQSVNSPIRTINGSLGRWVAYDNSKDDKPDVWGWLCWYNPNDRKEDSGVAQGWKANRQAINPHTSNLASILENATEGQYIPYPSQGGEIWLEIRRDGWQVSDGNVDLSETKVIDSYGLFYGDDWRSPKINWLMAKLPKIEIVNNVQFEQEISTEDVEYNAEINAEAKDALELDTICGTKAGGVPTARGAYFNAANGKQITELTRAGRTSQAEQLLIGTLYSQYGERRTKLNGEIELHPDGLVFYTEQNQEGKKFILIGEVQDVITDTTEATIIELRPDEYDKE